ncbi:MAG: NAD(P)-dependent oxidoreductase [Bryobacterales bacterium]
MKIENRNKKPTVVLTGSDGLIGSALVRALHADYDLVGLDNDHSTDIEGLHDLIYCDLTEDESVAHAFGQLRERHGDHIASFIHLAAYYDFSGADSPLYEQLTVEGTARILKQLSKFQVDQFVFTSTILVMEPSKDGEKLDESSPVQAEWQYPQSKLETEKLISRERGDIPAVILRIAGVYSEWGRAVPIVQQMKRIQEKELESYLFPGNPSHGQSMVHIDDVVSCIHRVIEKRRDLDGLEGFLIGEADAMSYEELQDQIGELLHGEEWPSIRIPKPLAKAGAYAKQALPGDEDFIQPWMVDLADQDYRIDIGKAQRLLDWRPQHSLRETLPRIAAHLIEDPDEWYERNGLEQAAEVEARQ